jgi:hypothetical protein
VGSECNVLRSGEGGGFGKDKLKIWRKRANTEFTPQTFFMSNTPPLNAEENAKMGFNMAVNTTLYK